MLLKRFLMYLVMKERERERVLREIKLLKSFEHENRENYRYNTTS